MRDLFEAVRGISCLEAAEKLGWPIKRRDGRAWARCPFHGEHTASLCLYDGDRGFYCFGCHEGGDAVRLYEKALNLSALEAASQLAAEFDFMQNPLPLDQWACFVAEQPQSDFKALPGTEAWERIREEQLPFLVELYERWLDDPVKGDFGAYRAEAHRRCAGLTHIWHEPFQAAYDVGDGRLLLRFRRTENGTEVAHDLIGK